MSCGGVTVAAFRRLGVKQKTLAGVLNIENDKIKNT